MQEVDDHGVYLAVTMFSATSCSPSIILEEEKMNWAPKTYEAHCCQCDSPVSVDFLSLNDIFAEKAFVLGWDENVVLDDKREKTAVDVSLLCEACKTRFSVMFSPERLSKEDFAARELDPRFVASQWPSINVRNDSGRFWIRIWADKEIPNLGRDFRVAPGETKYITGCWLGWLQFVTVTDPTATIISTVSPFITDVYMWDNSADQMAGGYPKTIWPQFTDGPKQISINLDVSDKLMFVFTPYYTRLIKEGLVKPEDLHKLSLKKANELMSKVY